MISVNATFSLPICIILHVFRVRMTIRKFLSLTKKNWLMGSPSDIPKFNTYWMLHLNVPFGKC
jgi:hypothetical protein